MSVGLAEDLDLSPGPKRWSRSTRTAGNEERARPIDRRIPSSRDRGRRPPRALGRGEQVDSAGVLRRASDAARPRRADRCSCSDRPGSMSASGRAGRRGRPFPASGRTGRSSPRTASPAKRRGWPRSCSSPPRHWGRARRRAAPRADRAIHFRRQPARDATSSGSISFDVDVVVDDAPKRPDHQLGIGGRPDGNHHGLAPSRGTFRQHFEGPGHSSTGRRAGRR